MNIDRHIPDSWKGVQTVEVAKQLIDYGVVLKWNSIRTIKKTFPEEQQLEIVKHLAVRFAEYHETRLAEEIIIETLLVWLSNSASEKQLQGFLEALLDQPNRKDACIKLVEIALTSEVSEFEHDDDMFSMAVAMVCELGLAIQMINKTYPGDFTNSQAVLDHIHTYLLSVSNSNSNRIRLSLLNYFGATEANLSLRPGFNKIIGRFGHTVLELLFHLLFSKKSEAIALEYLLDNLPYVLIGDLHGQRIVHETFRFFMLKQPSRFGLFLQELAEKLKKVTEPFHEEAQKAYFQHLGALLRVVSEVNHKELSKDIICAFANFEQTKLRNDVINQILEQPEIRKNIRELLIQLRDSQDAEKVVHSAGKFLTAKRGRKPSFARAEGLMTLSQISFLGVQELPIAKAS